MLGAFARLRMNALLKGQAFGAVGALVPRIADLIVSGNVLGIDALAGIAAVLPVVIGTQFLAKLVYCGAGYLFAVHQGAFEKEKARDVVGLSLEVAAVLGVLTWLLLQFGRDPYMDALDLSGAVREQAVAYWRWMAAYAAWYPVSMTLWRLVYADGETVTTAIADLLVPPTTVTLSVVFAKATGSAGGTSLGSMIGNVLLDGVMLLHLFRKSNAVVPRWNFSWRGVRSLVTYSLTDASSRMCQCGFMAIVNKLVVLAAGASFLPVVSMVALLMELREMLDRIGDAYVPLAEMYLGEGNVPRVKALAYYALAGAFAVGVALMALVAVFAPEIVALYGIPRGEVFDHSVVALRTCCLVLPFSSVVAFMTSHYLGVGRVALSVFMTIAAEFLLSAGCASAFCMAWGMDALWVGLPIGGALAVVLTGAYVWFSDRRRFPMLLPDATCEAFNVAFEPNEERVVAVRDEIERFLVDKGVPPKTVARVMLLVEECSMALVDSAGKSSRRTIVEDSVFVGPDAVRLVIRDTGKANDITDANAEIGSFRQFVIAGMMEKFSDRRYLNTIGCNRAAFAFARG